MPTTPVLRDQVLHREMLAQLGAGAGRGVREDRIEDRAARRKRVAATVVRRRRADEREFADVERHAPNRRTAGRRDGVEQAPAPEPRDARRPDDMRRDCVVGKRGAIDEQDAVPFARQQHRGRRSGAARSDDDDVVHAGLHPPCSTRAAMPYRFSFASGR
jgi:hypothetical protein